MKRIILFTLFGWAYHLGAQSILQTDSLFSPALGKTEKYQIYLPDGYTQNTNQRYPVVYFLHGALSDHEGYDFIKIVLDNLIATKKIQPMIVVKPNGGQGNYGGSMFANSALYGKVEDFIVKDLVAHVDQKYHTIGTRNARAVMGHSMGADGAARFGIQHPDVFCGFAAHSGSLDFGFARIFFSFAIQEQLQQKDSIPYEFQPNDGFATGALFRAAGAASPNLNKPPYFVDFPLDPQGKQIDSVFQKWFSISAANLVRRKPPTKEIGMFFDCGFQDEFGFLLFNNGFRDSLLESGLKFTYQNFTGGHGDKLLDRMAISLPYLDSLMSKLSTAVYSPEKWQDKITMRIYPNPGNDTVTLELSSPENTTAGVVLQNAAGQILRTLRNDWQINRESNQLQFDLGDLGAGMYWIVVQGEGFVASAPLQRDK